MAEHTTDTEIRVGDQVIHIEEPDGWKFLEATRLIGEITEAMPELTTKNAEYVRQYRRDNMTTFTRDQVRLQFPGHPMADRDDTWWAEHDNMVSILGEPPSQAEQFAAIFNDVFKQSRDRLGRLLAVLSSPSGELTLADEEGNIEEYLRKWEIKLLHSVKVSKLVLLLWRSVQAMQAEFAEGGEASAAVGEIRAFIQATQTPTESSPTAPDENNSTNSPPAAPPSSDVADTKPASSSDSASPSAGTAETPSTVPVGESSPSSAAISPAAS